MSIDVWENLKNVICISAPDISVCHNILLFLGRLQFPAHNDQHGNEAGGSPDEIGYGLREKNTVYGRGYPAEEKYGKRGHDNNLSEDGKKMAYLAFPRAWNTVCPENCRDIIKKPK